MPKKVLFYYFSLVVSKKALSLTQQIFIINRVAVTLTKNKNTMKVTEIKLKKWGFNISCTTYSAGQHYKFSMRSGSVFPSTKAQAKYFVSEKICLSMLNGDDVEKVEKMLNKHGFEGDYKLTKSKEWARLQNPSDLHAALKKEYSL